MNILYQQTSVSIEVLEASCFNYLNWISALPKIELSKQTDITLISANAPVLYFNAAIQPGFHGNTERRIEQTREYFLERGKSFNWLITPSSRPNNLTQQVLQRGGEFLEAVPGTLHDFAAGRNAAGNISNEQNNPQLRKPLDNLCDMVAFFLAQM